MRLRSVIGIVITLVISLAAASWLTYSHYTKAPLPVGPGQLTSTSSNTQLDHIVIIVEENKPYGSIIGSDQAPFINKLAADYALATNYYAIRHPSLPNYIAMTSGTTAGITSDCLPGPNCQNAGPNLATAIEKSGHSWKEYAESMRTPCYGRSSGDYAVKHNPFMYFPSITKDKTECQDHIVPLPKLSEDIKNGRLPNYAFVTPNLCSDMHNCGVKTGDDWLASWVPRILGSSEFKSSNSLVVITWDEGNLRSNKVPAIFAGPAARRHYKSHAAYNHYSLLRTVEQAWQILPLTDNDKKVGAMDDMLQ